MTRIRHAPFRSVVACTVFAAASGTGAALADSQHIGTDSEPVFGPQLPPPSRTPCDDCVPVTEAPPAKSVIATAEPATTVAPFVPHESAAETNVDAAPAVARTLPPRATPRIRIAGGFGYRTRSLTIGAENPDGVTQYAGVSDKALAVDAAFYPFPRDRAGARLSGIGFSLALDQSVGSTVTFDDLDTVSDYSIDQHGWDAGIHYRAAVSSRVSLDGEVGYGSRSYAIRDAAPEFEVPDTAYHYLHGGGRAEIAVADRASISAGAAYFHVLDTGDLSSVDWYGPGSTTGYSLGGNFIVPLPARLFVRGELSFTRFKTSFDGVGQITEDEGVYEAVDGTVSAGVKVGIEL